MKKIIIPLILTIIYTSLSYSQYSKRYINPTYRYVAAPWFVNITELIGAMGLVDTSTTYYDYYFGVTNIFGYQINWNFFGAIDTGCYICDFTHGSIGFGCIKNYLSIKPCQLFNTWGKFFDRYLLSCSNTQEMWWVIIDQIDWLRLIISLIFTFSFKYTHASAISREYMNSRSAVPVPQIPMSTMFMVFFL